MLLIVWSLARLAEVVLRLVTDVLELFSEVLVLASSRVD
jgi:hypothetical protein